jgi:hypothetical protein
MCVRAPQKSLFRRQTFTAAHKSGGRKPPVGSLLRLHRRSRAHRRQSPATLRKRSCKCASLTPTAGSRRSLDESVRNRSCVTHTHGGLTPAALGNVRSCIAKIVFSPANVRTAPRAGGVSPPWDVLGMRTRNAEIQRVAVATVVSDQQRADAGRWTKASAIATALLIPTAG